MDRRPASRPRWQGRPRQRGAAAIFLAVSLIALLTATGFALDLGLLYTARAELRKQAELTALDTVRVAGGCVNPDLSGGDRQQLANSAAAASLARSDSSAALVGPVQLGDEVLAGPLRRFVPTSPTNADAVSLTLQRPLPPQLLPLLPREDGARLTATAEATRAAIASFVVGSRLGSVSPGEVAVLGPLLEGVLGSDLPLALVSYRGLVDSSVQLVDVVAASGLETLDALLSEDFTAAGLLSTLAAAVLDIGDTVAAGAIQAIADAAPATAAVPFAETLGLPNDLPASAQDARVQSFDIVRAAVFNVQPVFSLTPDIVIPGVLSLRPEITLLSPPALGVGPVRRSEDGTPLTRAVNQQAAVALPLEVDVLGLPAVRLNLRLEAAEAEATLVDTHCASADDRENRVLLIAETGLARLRIDDSEPVLNLTIPLPIIGNVGARVYASAEADIGSAGSFGPRTFRGPFSTDPEDLEANTWTVATPLADTLRTATTSLANDLSLRTEVDLPLLGPVVGAIVNPVLNATLATTLGLLEPAIEGVVVALVDPVLDPLVRSLGISLGGADITVIDFEVPPPSLIAVR